MCKPIECKISRAELTSVNRAGDSNTIKKDEGKDALATYLFSLF